MQTTFLGDMSVSARPDSQEFTELLCQARAGESAALGELLHWYGGYLSVLARNQLDRRLRRRLNPSDIVQEAMLAAHRDFAGFRGGSQAEMLCWLRTILIHVLQQNYERHLKVRKRDVRREISLDHAYAESERSSLDLAAALAADIPSPSSALRVQESNRRLEDQLSGLSPDHRQVIVLRVVQGLAFEEIAQQMERSSGAVRMLWLRALRAFKMQRSEASTDGDAIDGCH